MLRNRSRQRVGDSLKLHLSDKPACWRKRFCTDLFAPVVWSSAFRRLATNDQRRLKAELRTLEYKSRLQLKRARRIDVSERRDRICSGADAADKLSESRGWRRQVAVSSNTASKHVRVVQEVEAFEAQNNVTS